jgi:hypothetical protein
MPYMLPLTFSYWISLYIELILVINSVADHGE